MIDALQYNGDQALKGHKYHMIFERSPIAMMLKRVIGLTMQLMSKTYEGNV